MLLSPGIPSLLNIRIAALGRDSPIFKPGLTSSTIAILMPASAKMIADAQPAGPAPAITIS